jgi:hypothetical protein
VAISPRLPVNERSKGSGNRDHLESMEIGDEELSLPELVGDVAIEMQPTKRTLDPSPEPASATGAAGPPGGFKKHDDSIRGQMTNQALNEHLHVLHERCPHQRDNRVERSVEFAKFVQVTKHRWRLGVLREMVTPATKVQHATRRRPSNGAAAFSENNSKFRRKA